MAGGGQRGLSFLGEDKAFTAGATALILLLSQALLGCLNGCGEDMADDPMNNYDHQCAQEYADANDGNSDTEVETAILEQPDCIAHMNAVKAERRQEQVETVEASP